MPTPEPQPPDRTRLRHHMEKRQEELEETWREIAARGGVPYETLRRVRIGSSPLRVTTRAALDRGLRWEPGSTSAILSGGDPTPHDLSDRYATTTLDLGDRVAHLARDLHASARDQGVPDAEAAAMTRRALERALGAAEGTGLLAIEAELRTWRHSDDTPDENGDHNG